MADIEDPRGASGAVGTPERDGLAAGDRDDAASAEPSAPKSHAARAKAKALTHLTPAERAARGKAARDGAPRAAHGEWEPASDRRDPVELLEEQAASRVPELVPIRYGRMLVSPFTFYRGAAYLMAADLAGAPRTGLDVQLCGDAHLSNFGAFAAPDRRLVFSVNDFDETLPGPFEWDVKRLVASFAVAGRDRGFDAKQRRSINLRRDALVPRGDARVRRDGEPRPLVLPDRRRRDRRAGRASRRRRKQLKRFERNVAKARSKDSMRAFGEAHDGRRRRAADRQRPAADRPDRGARVRRRAGRARGVRARSHPLLPADPDRRPPPAARALSLRRTPRARSSASAASARAPGSCSCSAATTSDPLFLQLKEAEASVLEPFLGKSAFAKHGQRVVEGQRLTQAASDIMLGWIRIADARRRRAATSTSASCGTARARRWSRRWTRRR